MLQIQNVTSDPKQTFTLILPDQTTLTMSIYYVQLQTGWFISSLTYGTFELTGVRITNQPNMLRQWRHIIPFGLSCFSDKDREPSLIQDFSSGASTLYILTAAEVAQYEAYLNG